MSSRFHLPRAREAVIPTDKLVGYALDPQHPRGGHKARVFAAALGIRQSHWRYLHDQILEAIVDAEVRGTRITPHGVLYDVVVFIDGLNGGDAASGHDLAGRRRSPPAAGLYVGGHPMTPARIFRDGF